MEEKTLSYDIGTRIAEIRRSHNVTQEVLSEMLDVSPKHQSHRMWYLKLICQKSEAVLRDFSL